MTTRNRDFSGPNRKRYERLVDLTGFAVGTRDPESDEPLVPQLRSVFNIGQEPPSLETEDWTIYAVPQLPEQWWFTQSDVLAYTLSRCPFFLELDAGVGPQKQRVDIPFQGIAIHLAASELRVALGCDPGTLNPESPPLTFEGRSLAVWARRGRTAEHWQSLSVGQDVGQNVVRTPTFCAQLLGEPGGATGIDRVGVTVFQTFSAGPTGIGWLAAEIGTVAGFSAGGPTMAARIIQ